MAGIIAWVFSHESQILGFPGLLEFIFTFVIAAGIGTVIAVNWNWICSHIASHKFGNLKQEIDETMMTLISYQSRYDIAPAGRSVYRSNHQPLNAVRANSRRLKIKLEKQLSVACPSQIETDGSNIDLWESFLADLSGLADSRDLSGAKTLHERLTQNCK